MRFSSLTGGNRQYSWLCVSRKYNSFLSFKIRKGDSVPILGLFSSPMPWWILSWIFKGNLLQISGVFSPCSCLLSVCPTKSNYHLLLNSQLISSARWVYSSQSLSFLCLPWKLFQGGKLRWLQGSHHLLPISPQSHPLWLMSSAFKDSASYISFTTKYDVTWLSPRSYIYFIVSIIPCWWENYLL